MENDSGLHSRTAALFVQICSKYKSEVHIEKDDFKINGKSIMGVMALGAARGETVNIIVDGPDQEEALEDIILFFKNLDNLD